MTKEPTNQRGAEAIFLAKNTLFALGSTLLLLFPGAVVATYLVFSETAVRLLVIGLTMLCIWWSGFRAARHAGRRGLLQGAVAGCLYMALLYGIGSAVYGELAFPAVTMLSLLMGVGCGALGGLMGVSQKKKRKR